MFRLHHALSLTEGIRKQHEPGLYVHRPEGDNLTTDFSEG